MPITSQASEDFNNHQLFQSQMMISMEIFTVADGSLCEHKFIAIVCNFGDIYNTAESFKRGLSHFTTCIFTREHFTNSKLGLSHFATYIFTPLHFSHQKST